MPNLTVIEGGGKGQPNRLDAEAEWAEDRFADLIVELIRAVARGDDRENRVLRALNAFIQHASNTSRPAAELVQGAIEWSHERGFGSKDDPPDYEAELRELVRTTLPLLAETLAEDDAAKGRKSRRHTTLTAALEAVVIGMELRSRSHGWSYTQHLVARLGPFKQPTKPGPSRKAISKRRKPKVGKSKTEIVL